MDMCIHIFNIHNQLRDVNVQLTEQLLATYARGINLIISRSHPVYRAYLYQHASTEIGACIRSYIHCLLMDLITRPYPDFNGVLA